MGGGTIRRRTKKKRATSHRGTVCDVGEKAPFAAIDQGATVG